ncbi:7003_t:CDS:2, partial [Funneliformis caledonium]
MNLGNRLELSFETDLWTFSQNRLVESAWTFSRNGLVESAWTFSRNRLV